MSGNGKRRRERPVAGTGSQIPTKYLPETPEEQDVQEQTKTRALVTGQDIANNSRADFADLARGGDGASAAEPDGGLEM